MPIDETTQPLPPTPVPVERATPGPPPRRALALKIATPFPALLLGGGAMGGLVAAGSAAEKSTPPEKVDLVDVLDIEATTARARVEATGTVTSDQQIVLSPEVAGRLSWVSDKLVPGGRFARGEVIARVDARDYEVAVDQARVSVEQAQLELALEENRGAVAAKEWALLGEGAGGDGRLARREPHLAVSKANVSAAEAGLRRAELNLGRTAIRAPFNAVILSESVDLGQVVGAASQIGVISGTDRVRVEVSVPFERLATLDVPGLAGVAAGEGSPATVTQRLSGERGTVREGRVVGVGGQLDPQTRTATVLVAVEQPLDPPEGELPLMVGAFVDVTIDGKLREQAVTIPRSAIYDGDTVWVVSDEGRLERRAVETGWSLSRSVEVTAGLSAGDQLVVTPLAAPIAGTRVRLRGADDGAAAGGQ